MGLKAVRVANFSVLGLGLLFIFLTFHAGDKNYLYPIMSGTLGWASLGPYLSLDLFFRPPYLAAWLCGYALGYYALTHAGRETWALYLTAACAGAYGLLCLRELAVFRNELLVADCLGAVSLWCGRRSGGRFQVAWLLAPALGSLAFAWAMFHLSGPHDVVPMLYFLTLLGASAILFGGSLLVARKWGFFGPWSKQVLFCFAAFLLLTNNHYPMASNYNNLLCLGLEFPRYFLGELVVVGALAIGAALYGRLWPKANLWWLDVFSLLLIAVALVDLRLSQIMGVRLDWDVLSLGNSPKMMWRMAKPYLPGAVAGLVVGVFVYALVVKGIQVWSCRARAGTDQKPPGQGAWYALACFLLLGVLGWVMANPDKAQGLVAVRLVETSSLWKRVANQPMTPGRIPAVGESPGFGPSRGGGQIISGRR